MRDFFPKCLDISKIKIKKKEWFAQFQNSWLKAQTVNKRMFRSVLKEKRNYQLLLLFIVQSLSPVWLWPNELHHATLPCPSVSPKVCSQACPWVGNASQPSQALLSPSPPALNLSRYQGLFQWVNSSHQVAKLLQLQHQSSALNIQGWFPLGRTSLISLLSKGLSRVFYITTVHMHQFFGTQLSLWSYSHIFA